MTAWRIGILLTGLASVTLAGCGGAETVVEKLAPVSGAVMVGGKPAAGVLISFHPLDKKGDVLEKGRVGVATSGTDGRFDARTYQPGDGLKPGDYLVTAQWPEPPPAGANPEQTGKDRLGERFAEPKKALTKVTVKEGDNKLDPFRIEE